MKLKFPIRLVKQISLGIRKKLWGTKNGHVVRSGRGACTAVAHCSINLLTVFPQTPWSHLPSNNLAHSHFPKPMIDFTQPREMLTPQKTPALPRLLGRKNLEQQDLSLENVQHVHVAVIDAGWLCRWYISSELPCTPDHLTRSQTSGTQGSSSEI